MQISRNSLTLLVGAAASALILSACGGGSSTPTPTGPVAQTISMSATKATLVTGDTSTLSITQSGTGAKTYALTGGTAQAKCALNSTTGVLTLAADAAIGGTCIVTGSVAADSNYLAATNTSTITVSPVIATFDEATTPGLDPFELSGTLLNPAVVIPAQGATITMKVYSPAVGKKTVLKLQETGDQNSGSQEVAVVSATANNWETMSFAFTRAGTYKVMAIFPNGTVEVNPSVDTAWYYDDIVYPTTGGGTKTIDFETDYPKVDVGFEGLVSSAVVVFPAGGTNKAAKLVKGNGGQTWAGATVINGGTPTQPEIVSSSPATTTNKALKFYKYTYSQPWAGLTIYKVASNKSVSVIPLTAQNKVMTMKAYSPAVGVRYTLKLEDASDNTKSVETSAASTVANQWETLTFDFSTQTPGTSAVNYSTVYNKLTVIPDFVGNNVQPLSSDKVYFVDDIKFGQ